MQCICDDLKAHIKPLHWNSHGQIPIQPIDIHCRQRGTNPFLIYHRYTLECEYHFWHVKHANLIETAIIKILQICIYSIVWAEPIMQLRSPLEWRMAPADRRPQQPAFLLVNRIRPRWYQTIGYSTTNMQKDFFTFLRLRIRRQARWHVTVTNSHALNA